MRDMSEHKVANETIERSRRFMQNVIDVSPGVMYIFDIQERKNVFSNGSAAAALGYAPWQVEAAEFVSSVMHPDDWSPFLDHLGRLASLRDEETADFEYRMRHNNGAWRWFHSRDKVFYAKRRWQCAGHHRCSDRYYRTKNRGGEKQVHCGPERGFAASCRP
jgi:PAS domain-containing protein